MILGDTLRFMFSTAKPLTNIAQDPAALPVIAVYRNGAVFVPAAPPVVANAAAGRYTLTYALTALNGHAANDWVTITAQVTLDGVAITVPIWEGNLVSAGADVTLVLGQRIYVMVTTHRPGNGENADQDPGALPGGGFLVRGYRNLAGLGFGVITLALNPAPGIYIMSLLLNPVAGWAVGDRLDMTAQTTIDVISTGERLFFSGGPVVAGGGPGPAAGGGTVHHEVMGDLLRARG